MRASAVLTLVLSALSFSVAADVPVYELVIKDHHFVPAELGIPANTKIKLLVKNQDATPAEFESRELNREKIIPGGSQTVIFIGPLAAGSYPFFDEFHMETTTGKIIAK